MPVLELVVHAKPRPEVLVQEDGIKFDLTSPTLGIQLQFDIKDHQCVRRTLNMETLICKLKTLTETYAGFELDVAYTCDSGMGNEDLLVRSQMVGTPPCGLFCWIPNCVHATFCTGNRSAVRSHRKS